MNFRALDRRLQPEISRFYQERKLQKYLQLISLMTVIGRPIEERITNKE